MIMSYNVKPEMNREFTVSHTEEDTFSEQFDNYSNDKKSFRFNVSYNSLCLYFFIRIYHVIVLFLILDSNLQLVKLKHKLKF